MRRLVAFFLVLAPAAFAADPTAETGLDLPFRVQRLTDRVLVFTELSPWESNHVVIVGTDGLALVDPGHSPLMGRLLREAVTRELGRVRFAYVIDTHGHWGHCWGNAAFPEALIVGHERVAGEMEANPDNVQQVLAFSRDQIEQIDAQLETLAPEGEAIQELMRRRQHFENLVQGLAETGFELRAPQLTFSDRLDLDLGGVTLRMSYLGSAHSSSDILVQIPEEKVLLLGCFFLEQGPLPVFGAQPVLTPDRWLAAFDDALADPSAVRQVVLGQHSIWTREKLAGMRDYIAWLWSGVRQLDSEGVDFETAVARLPVSTQLDFLRDAGVGGEQLAQYQRGELAALWRQVKESAAAAVERAIDEGGVEAGLATYRRLAADRSAEVFFDETELNRLGYRYLGEGRVDEAIAVLQINVERFPDSWNTYDSLGEAFAARGDIQRAVELYRRSLELNPDNANGAHALERLAADGKVKGVEH